MECRAFHNKYVQDVLMPTDIAERICVSLFLGEERGKVFIEKITLSS